MSGIEEFGSGINVEDYLLVYLGQIYFSMDLDPSGEESRKTSLKISSGKLCCNTLIVSIGACPNLKCQRLKRIYFGLKEFIEKEKKFLTKILKQK